jgi:transposase-like protein
MNKAPLDLSNMASSNGQEGIMKTESVTLLEWQKRFGTEADCLGQLIRYRWPDGFICPHCGHDRGYFIGGRHIYQCTSCARQVSVTAGTIFEASKLPLVKWFWAIYLMASDKGGVSALRLAQQIEVSWLTAHRMLRKIRQAMGHRDSLYRLGDLIEVDDALVGGRHTGGKRGRGAEGKTPVLVAVENRDEKAGHVAMEAVASVTQEAVRAFAKRHFNPAQLVRSDALASLSSLGETQHHVARVTPAGKAGEWLPWVHITIGNLKAFLLGTYHGVSGKYLQEYLNEFCYRFNRRRVLHELPLRLLNACVTHVPIRHAGLC